MANEPLELAKCMLKVGKIALKDLLFCVIFLTFNMYQPVRFLKDNASISFGNDRAGKLVFMLRIYYSLFSFSFSETNLN